MSSMRMSRTAARTSRDSNDAAISSGRRIEERVPGLGEEAPVGEDDLDGPVSRSSPSGTR